MGRVADAMARAAALREAKNEGILADSLLSHARHDTDTRLLRSRHLERFPAEGVRPPQDVTPKPEPQAPVLPVRDSGTDGIAESRAPEQPQAYTQVGPHEPVFSENLSEKLVVMSETNPVAIEQYRKLAATLHQRQLERHSKVVMVSSAVAGEGKTLTAMNLALTLSESFQQRVLLVDADLRRPQIHALCQVSGAAGLNDALQSSDDFRLPVFRVSPHLLVLPAGQPDPDPMRLLTSDRMRRVIAEASAAFDWVILDSPPVAHLPDAHLLAAMVDLAVLVVAAGRTPYAAIARAADALGRDRVIGVVLNQVEESALATTRELAYATFAGGAVEGSAAADEG